MRTGTATIPLHHGRAPRWLFNRMSLLARSIITAMVVEFGTAETLKKLSDPYWFQCLGCTLGFDWHSSGITTTVTGAIKEGLKDIDRELGLFVAGGKGKASRKTLEEIVRIGEQEGIEADSLVYASRMSAKVDNSAVQDGFQLYHHTIFFDRAGHWSVVQQGMNTCKRLARRYHWHSQALKSFVEEPHTAVCSDLKTTGLNLVHRESSDTRNLLPELMKRAPEKNLKDLKSILKTETLFMPRRHLIIPSDIKPERIYRILLKTYETDFNGFEGLLGLQGVGAKTIRALSLIAELIYGVKPSYEDPARYSYTVGGKDGTPYPVDRRTYDRVIEIMRKALEKSPLQRSEKLKALKRLYTHSQGLFIR